MVMLLCIFMRHRIPKDENTGPHHVVPCAAIRVNEERRANEASKALTVGSIIAKSSECFLVYADQAQTEDNECM